MAEVAVFDRKAVGDEGDLWRELLANNEHEWVGASTLPSSIDAIVRMQQGQTTIPDVMLIGDRLGSSTHEYIAEPRILRCAHAQSRLRLGRQALQHIVLLPSETGSARNGLEQRGMDVGRVLTDGRMVVPDCRSPWQRELLEKIQVRYRATLERDQMRAAPDLFIVGHVARILLGANCPEIIGVSTKPLPVRAPVNQQVRRDQAGGKKARYILSAISQD